MRRTALLLWLMDICLSVSASAQMSLQRYYLESAGFEYVSLGQSAKRCVQWRDLVNKRPIIKFENEKPFVMLDLAARIEGNCPLKFADGKALNVVASEGSIKTFRFKVYPPAASFVVSGPGFSDQLIFEGLVSQPEQLGFFKFFEESQTSFDLGYGTFKTTNASMPASVRSSNVFPIMSGLITVPFPWIQRVQLGFSLSQNLSNVMPDSAVRLQFSEFAFDSRYVIGGGSNQMLSIVGEIRGRNWYQLGSQRPFVVRSSSGVSFGADFDSWFGDSKWGYSLSGRYGIRSASSAKSLGELRAGTSLNYKVSKKWALGAGYKWTQLGVDFTDSSSQSALGKLYETSQIFNLSLILISNRGRFAQ